MQTIGTIAPPSRYERLPVKERALEQLKLRIEKQDWTFNTVKWTSVQRKPATPAQLKAKNVSVLAIVDGEEAFDRSNTQAGEATVEVAMEFSVGALGRDEEASTVLNIVAAEIMEVLSGDHKLEDDNGDQLAVTLYARSFTPDYDAVNEGMNPIGLVIFDMRYRFRKNKPFDLHNR